MVIVVSRSYIFELSLEFREASLSSLVDCLISAIAVFIFVEVPLFNSKLMARRLASPFPYC